MKIKFLLICIFMQLQSLARPIIVVVSNLIGSAKYIDKVVITNYDGKGGIYFQSIKYKDTLKSASCGRQIKNGWNFPYKKDENYWTENQPFIGDTVLIFIDGNDRVKAYGKRIDNYYRLWSPLMSGSLAMFNFEGPVKPIEESKLLSNSDTNKVMACWDGCLIPIDKLNFLISKYKTKFSKNVNSVNLKEFQGESVYAVFYNDTLKHYTQQIWSDEPPGKLHSLILTYNNGKSLEVIPVTDSEHPRQFSENRKFDMDKFKQMKIKKIEWIN